VENAAVGNKLAAGVAILLGHLTVAAEPIPVAREADTRGVPVLVGPLAIDPATLPRILHLPDPFLKANGTRIAKPEKRPEHRRYLLRKPGGNEPPPGPLFEKDEPLPFEPPGAGG
jgi:hypothetical protein